MKKDFYALSFLMLMAIYGHAQVIWEEHPSGYSEPVIIFDVDVVDATTIWTTSFKGNFSGNAWSMVTSNLMSKSTDGGQTWQEIVVPVPNSDWGISNVHALDGMTAWISLFTFGGQGDVYKTSDGGATWTNLDANTAFTNFVHFWDDKKGIAMGVDGYLELYTT